VGAGQSVFGPNPLGILLARSNSKRRLASTGAWTQCSPRPIVRPIKEFRTAGAVCARCRGFPMTAATYQPADMIRRLVALFFWFSGPSGYQCAAEAPDGTRTWYSYGPYKEQPACTVFDTASRLSRDAVSNFGRTHHVCRYREYVRDFVRGLDSRTSHTAFQDATRAWTAKYGDAPPGTLFKSACGVSGWKL